MEELSLLYVQEHPAEFRTQLNGGSLVCCHLEELSFSELEGPPLDRDSELVNHGPVNILMLLKLTCAATRSTPYKTGTPYA